VNAAKKKPGDPAPEGKTLLIAAAVRLAAKQSAVQSLVLREVAREAGLNHNTLYRHFGSLEQLMEEAVGEFVAELRAGLSAERARAGAGLPVSPAVLSWLFDFAHEHEEVFIVAARERHGPAGRLRTLIREAFTGIRKDMLRDLLQLGVLPAGSSDKVERLLGVCIDHALGLCLQYLEQPSRRARLIDAGTELFMTMVTGAAKT